MKTLRLRLFLFAAFLAVFPFFLQRRPRVERRITILAPPGTVFSLLEDLSRWPLWTAWTQQHGRHFVAGENARGTGAEMTWHGADGDGFLRIVRSEPDHRLDFEAAMDGGYQLVGRFELQPDGACTRLTWKCAWDLAENPYRRYFDLLLRWMLRRDFAQGLANLKALAERGGAVA